MKVFLFLLAIFLCSSAFSSQIEITAKGYAGKSLTIKKSENFLLSVQPTLGEIVIPDNEVVSFDFEVKQPTRIFLNFDIYEGWLIVEPHGRYKISLPEPSQQKTKSPFFEPLSFHFLPEKSDSSSLNFLIEKYQRIYDSELDENISKLVYGKSSTTARQIIERIELAFAMVENDYFENYRKLNYASIELLAQPRSKNAVLQKYLTGVEVKYGSKEYADFFNQLFTNFFTTSEWSSGIDNLKKLLNSGNLTSLKLNIAEVTQLNDQLCEAIVLYNLEDLFFSRRYNPNGLMKLLKEIEAKSIYTEHQAVAKYLNHKFLLHLPGAAAPSLNIPDSKGNLYNWGDSYFKYVYLYFANDDTLTLNKNLKYLEQISNSFLRDLEIVIVVPKDVPNPLAESISKNETRYMFLSAETNDEVYDRFDVRVFPTFYLIDPKGKMVWFQTPWPEEKFAIQFQQVISRR